MLSVWSVFWCLTKRLNFGENSLWISNWLCYSRSNKFCSPTVCWKSLFSSNPGDSLVVAKMKSLLFVVVSVLLVSAWIPVSRCSKKPVMGARKEDIPYIKCQVCEKLAAQLYHQVQKKQAEISPKKVFFYYYYCFFHLGCPLIHFNSSIWEVSLWVLFILSNLILVLVYRLYLGSDLRVSNNWDGGECL